MQALLLHNWASGSAREPATQIKEAVQPLGRDFESFEMIRLHEHDSRARLLLVFLLLLLKTGCERRGAAPL